MRTYEKLVNFIAHLCMQRLDTFLPIGERVVLWRTQQGKDLMQPKPQPLRGFLFRLIHLHNLEHMKGAFLSMEVGPEVCIAELSKVTQ